VRWESIEILLGPEEHVPFIQNAVRNFAIKNPDTGEPFPVDLPKEAFPLTTDVEIELWHSQCAQRLKQQATPDLADDIGSRPDLPPRSRVQTGFTHVRPRPKTGYFEPRIRPQTRPIPFQHVSGTGRPVRPGIARSPTHRARQFLAPEMPDSPDSPRLARSRRRSFPENMNTSPVASPHEPSPDLKSPPIHVRRHSHPRHERRGSVSSDASSEDEDSPSDIMKARRKSYPHPNPRDQPNPSARFDYPSPESSPQMGPPIPPNHRPRTRVRREAPEENRERPNYTIPIDLNGKLSEPFMMARGGGVPRNSSRGGNVRWKDLSDISNQWRKNGDKSNKSSEEDRDPLRREGARHSDLERERESGSGGSHKRRERERIPRHAGVEEDDVRSGKTSPRERDWEREREREMERDNRESNGRPLGDGKSFRERARDRRDLSPVRGVGKDARYYPMMR
jgi:hypothetical protein